MKLDKKKETSFRNTQKTRYAARAAFWSTVLCFKKGLIQRVEDGGREKIPGKKIFGFVENERAEREREERVVPSNQRTFECDLV